MNLAPFKQTLLLAAGSGYNRGQPGAYPQAFTQAPFEASGDATTYRALAGSHCH